MKAVLAAEETAAGREEQAREQAQQIRDSVFCTAAGKRLLEDIFFKTPPVPSSFAVSLP